MLSQHCTADDKQQKQIFIVSVGCTRPYLFSLPIQFSKFKRSLRGWSLQKRHSLFLCDEKRTGNKKLSLSLFSKDNSIILRRKNVCNSFHNQEQI